MVGRDVEKMSAAGDPDEFFVSNSRWYWFSRGRGMPFLDVSSPATLSRCKAGGKNMAKRTQGIILHRRENGAGARVHRH